MSFKSATDQVQIKNFIEVLKNVPAPKKINPSSVNGAFREYFDYLFNVAQRLNSFFKEKSFITELEKAGIPRPTVDNLRFWSTMIGKTPDVASKEVYFGNQNLAYIQELASVNDPKKAIYYIEQVLGIKSKTQNPAELVASLCDSMARNIYTSCQEAHKILTEQTKEQTGQKKGIFGIFSGHEK